MGYPHPDYLLTELTSRQLKEWEIYYSYEPFGEEQQFLQAGIISSTIANVFSSEKTRKLSPKDFMPFYRREVKKQSTDEMKGLLSSMSSVKKKRKIDNG